MKYDNEFQQRPWLALIWMTLAGLIASGLGLIVKTLF